jgi:hypothetical protein
VRQAPGDPGAQAKEANDERTLFIVSFFCLCSRGQGRQSIAQRPEVAVDTITNTNPVEVKTRRRRGNDSVFPAGFVWLRSLGRRQVS